MKKPDFKKGEIYHIYNRGVDERNVFVSKEDYDRFEAYLFLLNDLESPRAANFFVGKRHESLFESARAEQLIAIGAYSLLPTQFHLVITPLLDGGVSKFMQKLTTAYTMYFNDKYQRSGALFEGTYRAKESTSDNHSKYLLAKTHLYPAQLFNKSWREDSILELEKISNAVGEYRYSSMNEYTTNKHAITSPEHFPRYLSRAKDIDTFFRYWEDNKGRYIESV